jgi:CRP-like cAMP-binding protein
VANRIAAHSFRRKTEVLVCEKLNQAERDPTLADIFLNLPHKLVYVEHRRPFREPGIPRADVILVRSGILAKFKYNGNSGRQIVSLRFAGEGILGHEAPADYGLQAITRSEVLIAKAADFRSFVSANPETALLFWKLVERQIAIGYEWLVNTGGRTTIARVAHFLCETAVRMGDGSQRSMINPFTQQQIAEITGQTSVNVNRMFADLERRGLIERRGREILFNDWNEMRQVGGFHPAYLG